MQIETDRIEFLSGVRAGETLGSPIAMLIRNSDWKNWVEIMDPAPRAEDADGPRKRNVTRVRPGHADLTGILKYDRTRCARHPRASVRARNDGARRRGRAVPRAVAGRWACASARHLVHSGGSMRRGRTSLPDDLNAAADASPLRTLDRDAEAR